MIFSNSLTRKRAIAYYRHSAEDKQENSVAIQREHAQRFAQKNDLEIIHEESDEGKSGLSADRAGFQNLFNNWILNDRAPPFEYVLVYDVSRWGRFQNLDEGAMYQYQCAQRGKKLVFVEKGKIEEEQALIFHLQTSIERFMAAEYSRQLSGKVFYGSVKISEQGYSAGGMACYVMSRLLLDLNKQPIRLLSAGEHKQISNERVTFVPTNDVSTSTVREIFDLFVTRSFSVREIASMLNDREIPSPKLGEWNASKVRKILVNEAYAGTRVYNKRWSRLKQKSKHNPRSEWVIFKNAFPSIVSPEIFAKAQEKVARQRAKTKSSREKFVSAIERRVHAELRQILIEKRLSEHAVSRILKYFPVTFSVSFTSQDSPKWCFPISESMKNFEEIFAIGLIVAPDGSVTQEILRIPFECVKEQSFFLISKQSSDFDTHQLSNEMLEVKVRITLDRMCNEYSVKRLLSLPETVGAEMWENEPL